MQRFAADLHLHSVLSPCGDLEMSPRNILARARCLGLDLIAITDHNMVENGLLLRDLAPEYGLGALYGMELATQEEVHLLCLFDDPAQAAAWQEYVYPLIPDIENRADHFGEQVVINLEEEVLRFEKKLLISGAQISLEEACQGVEAHGGLVIPSHVDKPVDSILSQIGFVPEDLCFLALEITAKTEVDSLLLEHPTLERFQWVRFSDAHFLADMGKQHTVFHIEAPTIEELRLALAGRDGRAITLHR